MQISSLLQNFKILIRTDSGVKISCASNFTIFRTSLKGHQKSANKINSCECSNKHKIELEINKNVIQRNTKNNKLEILLNVTPSPFGGRLGRGNPCGYSIIPFSFLPSYKPVDDRKIQNQSGWFLLPILQYLVK